MDFVHLVQTVKFQDLEWSLWDRWILEGDLTVQQVLDWFKVPHSSWSLRTYALIRAQHIASPVLSLDSWTPLL